MADPNADLPLAAGLAIILLVCLGLTAAVCGIVTVTHG